MWLHALQLAAVASISVSSTPLCGVPPGADFAGLDEMVSVVAV